jgi:hypothetical protein
MARQEQQILVAAAVERVIGFLVVLVVQVL